MATTATMRGQKVCTIDGEGGVLVNGFDAQGNVMVEITFAQKTGRLGRVETYHVSELFDPTAEDLVTIPQRPPPAPLDGWVVIPRR